MLSEPTRMLSCGPGAGRLCRRSEGRRVHTTGGEDLEFVELPEAALWSVDTSHMDAGV